MVAAEGVALPACACADTGTGVQYKVTVAHLGDSRLRRGTPAACPAGRGWLAPGFPGPAMPDRAGQRVRVEAIGGGA